MPVDSPLQSLTVDGLNLGYREAGSGAPLLLLHGNSASGRWFQPQLLAPPAGWQLLAPDLPNYGHSGPLTPGSSIEDHTRSLLGFLAQLGVDEPVVLVGHSLGGGVAQALAALAPDRVRALLLIASAPPGGFVTPEENYPLLELLPGNTDMLRAALTPITLCHVELFEELLQDALLMKPHALSDGARALAALDVSAAASRADFPVLVLHGSDDPLITAEQARATRDAYPNATLETWPTGHSPQLEVPERFNDLLRRFLEDLP